MKGKEKIRIADLCSKAKTKIELSCLKKDFLEEEREGNGRERERKLERKGEIDKEGERGRTR